VEPDSARGEPLVTRSENCGRSSARRAGSGRFTDLEAREVAVRNIWAHNWLGPLGEFAADGKIDLSSLTSQIAIEIEGACDQNFEDLTRLMEYVRLSGNRGPVFGWGATREAEK
jgi:hypothetical protein